MPQIDPQKNISFYYNFTSIFFESDTQTKIELSKAINEYFEAK